MLYCEDLPPTRRLVIIGEPPDLMSAQGGRRVGGTPGHHSSQPCSGEVSSKNFARDMGYVADFRRRPVRRCWHSPTRRTRAFCPCWANLWLSLPYRRERHKDNERHDAGGILCHAFSIGEENLPLEGSETPEPVKCCRTGIIEWYSKKWVK